MQVAVVVGMIGITYASVPLYRMFCQVQKLPITCLQLSSYASLCFQPLIVFQATGFGGTVQRVKTVEEKIRDTTPEKER